MTSAIAYPPGPSTGGNFASEILYLKMKVTSTADLQFTCTYVDGSGVFVPPGGGLIRDQDLDGYIQNLHNGTAGPLGPIYGAGTLVAPDGDTDSFNLLIHLAQNTGNVIDAKIDPHIKNRG